MPSKPITITVTDSTLLVSSLPPRLRRQAGIKTGDQLEVSAIPGVITIVTKPPIPEDEYTPEQRRIIDAQIAEGLEDIRRGRVSRRFDTVDEMLTSMKAAGKASRGPKTALDEVATLRSLGGRL